MPCKSLKERKAELAAEASLTTVPIQSESTGDWTGKPKRPDAPLPAFPFFMSATLGSTRNRFEQKAQRQLEVTNPYNFINNYTNIRLKTFTERSNRPDELYNIFDTISKFFGLNGTSRQPGYENALQYVVVGTRLDTNETEAMFSLPQNIDRVSGSRIVYPKDYFQQSRSLENYLKSTFLAGKNAAEVIDIGLNKEKLLDLVRGVVPQPPLLIKQEGNSFSLAKLRERYGKRYETLFSSPYIITGLNARFNDPKLVGRTVVLYKKFPDGEAVDDTINREGISDNEKFGYLTLNEGSIYRNLDEMLGVLKGIGIAELSYNQRRLVISDNIVDTITTLFGNEFGTDTFNSIFEKKTVELGGGHTRTTNRTNYQGFVDLLESIKADRTLENKLNRVLADPVAFPNGVYISPALASTQELRGGIFARVDASTDGVSKLLYNNLLVRGLADAVTSVGSFALDLKAEDLPELFSTDISGITRVNSGGKVVKIAQAIPRISQVAQEIPVGREVKVNQAELLAFFQFKNNSLGIDLPINSSDLNNFVSSLSDTVMGFNSQVLTTELTNLVTSENPC